MILTRKLHSICLGITFSVPRLLRSKLQTPSPILRQGQRIVFIGRNGIALWVNFEDSVRHYWNNVVSQADKQQYVFTLDAYSNASQFLATGMATSLEDAVKACIDTFPVTIHYAAATGLNGAQRPTDRHSIFQRWGLGIEGNNVAGVPDFIMATEYGHLARRITLLVEVKNPWQVTPPLIDAVISSTIILPLLLLI